VRAHEVLGPVAFLAGIIGLFPLQSRIDEQKPPMPSSLLYTPDRRLMSVIACGHGPTLADLVWVQSTDYVMRQFHSGGAHIEHLYALYDVMTDLDPNFVDAYVMGSIFLSAIGEEPDRAIELLEKGEGRIEEVQGEMREVSVGRVHPQDKQRWRLLHETAAVHLVSFAGYAPTLEERYEEILVAGKLYLYGAKRYPLSEYPDCVDWFQTVGEGLVSRFVREPNGLLKDVRFNDFSHGDYYDAVSNIWLQRLGAVADDSPLRKVYERGYLEIQSRKNFEQDVAEVTSSAKVWKEGHGGATPQSLRDLHVKLHKDPLGMGWFLVDGTLVAPALDAASLERGLEHDAATYHRIKDVWPSTLDELLAAGPKGSRRTIPPWVKVRYDPTTGEVHAEGSPPRLSNR